MRKKELKESVDGIRLGLKENEPLYLWIRLKDGEFRIGEVRNFKALELGTLMLGYASYSTDWGTDDCQYMHELRWKAALYKAKNIDDVRRVQTGEIIRILQKVQAEISNLRHRIDREFEVRFSGKYGSLDLSRII